MASLGLNELKQQILPDSCNKLLTDVTDYDSHFKLQSTYQLTEFSEFFPEFAYIFLSGIVNQGWLCHLSEYEFPET